MTDLKKEHWDLLFFVRDGAKKAGERIQDGQVDTLEGLLSLGAVRYVPCFKCPAGGEEFHAHYQVTYFGLRLLRAHEASP